MSNRILGVLIIIGFIGVGYLYYNLTYLPNKELKIQKQLDEQQQIIEQEKEVKKDIVLTKQINDKVETTNQQKIEELKANNTKYKTFTLDNGKKIYFLEFSNKLDLYVNDNKIGNFELVSPEFLRLELVDGSISDLYIEVGGDKFYYDSIYKNIVKVNLDIDVIYVKKVGNNNLIFVTNKGSFNYSIFNKTLEYFTYFNDYIIYDDGYIGIVKKDEKRILTNLGFETDNNLVVYYNPTTKEKNILYKTDLEIKKIYLNNNKVLIKNYNGEIFELENIE